MFSHKTSASADTNPDDLTHSIVKIEPKAEIEEEMDEVNSAERKNRLQVFVSVCRDESAKKTGLYLELKTLQTTVKSDSGLYPMYDSSGTETSAPLDTIKAELEDNLSTSSGSKTSPMTSEVIKVENTVSRSPSTEEPELKLEIDIGPTEIQQVKDKVVGPTEIQQVKDKVIGPTQIQQVKDKVIGPTQIQQVKDKVLDLFRNANLLYKNEQETNTYMNFVTTNCEETFYCDFCPDSFHSSMDLFTHRKLHTNQPVYACNFCDRKFNDRKRLAYHTRYHTGDKPFTCDICGKSFTQKYSIIPHLKRHMEAKSFTCEVCGKHFTLRSSYLAHRRYHIGDKPFTCDICGQSFTRKHGVIRHLKCHTGATFPCKVCGIRFTHRSYVAVHMNVHRKKPAKPYECDVCKRHYAHKFTLTKHKRKHGIGPLFKCDIHM